MVAVPVQCMWHAHACSTIVQCACKLKSRVISIHTTQTLTHIFKEWVSEASSLLVIHNYSEAKYVQRSRRIGTMSNTNLIITVKYTGSLLISTFKIKQIRLVSKSSLSTLCLLNSGSHYYDQTTFWELAMPCGGSAHCIFRYAWAGTGLTLSALRLVHGDNSSKLTWNIYTSLALFLGSKSIS